MTDKRSVNYRKPWPPRINKQVLWQKRQRGTACVASPEAIHPNYARLCAKVTWNFYFTRERLVLCATLCTCCVSPRPIVLKYIGYNIGSRWRRECNSISRRYRDVHLNTRPIIGRKNLFQNEIYAPAAYRVLLRASAPSDFICDFISSHVHTYTR